MILPGILSSQISGHLFTLTGSYDALATVTVPSGGASSIVFSAIPQTGYKHLQIRATHRGNRATYPVSGTILQFNGDTGSNYSGHNLTGNGSSASAGNDGVSITSIDFGQPGTSVTPFAASIIDILDYANINKNKVTRTLNGVDVNGTVAGYGGTISLKSGLWINTSAINSIYIATADGSAWQQYSTFSLYGVK